MTQIMKYRKSGKPEVVWIRLFVDHIKGSGDSLIGRLCEDPGRGMVCLFDGMKNGLPANPSRGLVEGNFVTAAVIHETGSNLFVDLEPFVLYEGEHGAKEDEILEDVLGFSGTLDKAKTSWRRIYRRLIEGVKIGNRYGSEAENLYLKLTELRAKYGSEVRWDGEDFEDVVDLIDGAVDCARTVWNLAGFNMAKFPDLK